MIVVFLLQCLEVKARCCESSFSKKILIFLFYFSKEGHVQRKTTKTFKLLVISQLMRV